MKKATVVLVVLALVCCLVLVSCGAKKTVTLKLSEVHVDGYPTTMADKEFARLVEERTDGRVKIEVYSNGTLYGEETGAIEAMQIGDCAFARVSASPVASYVPALNVIQLPYLYNSTDHMWAVLNGEIGQGMLDAVEESGSGLIGLCWYDSGSRSFYTTKAVHQASDLKGLKIRMQNNEMMCEIVRLCGGTPITGIGPNDIYSAVQQGVIDGAENNWPTYYSKGDYEVATYYCLDAHTRVPEILLGSVAALKNAGVSESDIAIIKACAKETQEYEIAAWKAMEKEAEAGVRGNGNTVYEPSLAELKTFQDAVAPIYAKYGAGYEDIIAQIKATKY
ncbi:MAG: TRAP transporter substrate-binding protein [Sphaerochaetaceae bacterium]|nr:TRAP transporter substrate-binding protein [Sphaerochaetaceae bacterium]